MMGELELLNLSSIDTLNNRMKLILIHHIKEKSEYSLVLPSFSLFNSQLELVKTIK